MKVMPVGCANSEQHAKLLHTVRTKNTKASKRNIPEVFKGEIPQTCSRK